MKELFTLYYHRRILFTDFFSQSRKEKTIKHPLYRLIHDEPNPEMLTSNPQPKPYRNFPAIHFFSNQTKK
jgi:hypothetical protein